MEKEKVEKPVVNLSEDGKVTRDSMMAQVLKDAEPLPKEKIEKEIRAFLKRFSKSRYFILNSKKINYIAIFDSNNTKIREKTNHILDYMDSSVFYFQENLDINEAIASPKVTKLIDVKDIFTEEDGSLGMYIDTVYFRLYSGDNFVEATKDFIKEDK